MTAGIHDQRLISTLGKGASRRPPCMTSLPSTVQEDHWFRPAIAYEVNRQMYAAVAG